MDLHVGLCRFFFAVLFCTKQKKKNLMKSSLFCHILDFYITSRERCIYNSVNSVNLFIMFLFCFCHFQIKPNRDVWRFVVFLFLLSLPKGVYRSIHYYLDSSLFSKFENSHTKLIHFNWNCRNNEVKSHYSICLSMLVFVVVGEWRERKCGNFCVENLNITLTLKGAINVESSLRLIVNLWGKRSRKKISWHI